MESLSLLLNGLVSGALVVPVVSWLLSELPGKFTKSQKRYLALAVALILGTAAFVLSAYFDYLPMPANTVQAWAEALWPVWFAAFTASQAVLSTYKDAKYGRDKQ